MNINLLWKRNKTLILLISTALFVLVIFALAYTYYWLPRIYQMSQNKQRASEMKAISSYSNLFSLERFEVGDIVGNMVIVEKRPFRTEQAQDIPLEKNILVKFKGEATIKGTYYYSGPMGTQSPDELNAVCITSLDDASLSILPRPTTASSVTRFCFSNSEYAFEKLGPLSSTGEATVVIDDYTIINYPGEVSDEATLVKVVEVTKK